jgi:hypothetical protein
MIRRAFWPYYRIVPTLHKRMATQNPFKRHPGAFSGAESIDRFHRVFGTTRYIAARRRQHGRNEPFVSAKHREHDGLGDIVHLSVSSFARLTVEAAVTTCFSITSKARRTSFCKFANSVVRNDFFGLITTSTETFGTDSCSRTASRKRRFMRLRSTAPPNARPTVKPMRIPLAGPAFSPRRQ